MRRWSGTLHFLLPWVIAVLITGPLLLGRGFWSFGDMVFTPHQPWKPEWYGGDGGVPRAVPGDALVSLLTHVVPGDIVQKVILVVMLGCAGWGMLRLFRDAHPVAGAAACVFYMWNPYVFERLAIGHWALLCGYATLPWVAAGSHALARGRPRAWSSVLIPAALAAWTSPTGGVLAALAALGVFMVSAAREERFTRGVGVLSALVVINLPWLLPGVLGAGSPADPGGASAFAARADTPYGMWGSVLTLGGIWKTSIVPLERSSALVTAMALALSAVALAGVVMGLRRCAWRSTVLGLAVTALPLLVFVWASDVSAGQEAVEWLVTHVPGGGLVRDSQKWLALPALLLALGLGVAVDGYASWCGAVLDRAWAWTAIVLVLVPPLMLPSLAWGNLGQWPLSRYPQEWADVAALVGRDSPDETRASTVVLPFAIYRRFPWNGEQAWLDPAPRILPGRVVVDDSLGLGSGRVVEGESETARAIRDSSQSWNTLLPVLDEAGVRYVLVESETPGQLPEGDIDQRLALVYEGESLQLYDRGQQQGSPSLPTWGPWLLLLDGALFAAFVLTLLRAGMRLITSNRSNRAT